MIAGATVLLCAGVFAQTAAQQESNQQTAGGSFVDLTARHADPAGVPVAAGELKDPPNCPAGSGGEINFQMPFGGASVLTPPAHPQRSRAERATRRDL